MGSSRLGRGMWGGLWPQSNCQEDPGAGAGEDGELPGQVAKGCISGVCIWGRGRLRGSSGFHCAKAQCLSKQLCLCGSLVLRVCVERCAEEEGRQKSILFKSPE